MYDQSDIYIYRVRESERKRPIYIYIRLEAASCALCGVQKKTETPRAVRLSI